MKKDKEWLKEAVSELNLVDTVFEAEADGVSYIDTAVSLMQVYDLIDQLEDSEKVVIPKFVADWIEEMKQGECPLYNVMSSLTNKRNHEWTIWKRANKNFSEIVAQAWLYGYEVEKEKLYYVLDKQSKTLLVLMGGEVRISGGYVLSESTANKDIYQLTEKQIKDYDQRFWSFAKEVAE